MAGGLLVEAGVAIDALFNFVQSDKLKLVDLFTRIDRDRSGTLEREELAMCLTMLGVSVKTEHLDAIIDVLDVDGDGSIVIGEFFESMERLKEELKAARKAAAKAAESSLLRSQRLRAASEAQGTATSAFFTIIRSRAGFDPGSEAPRQWNRVDCDGDRGVLPAKEMPWEKPPERPKDLDQLHGKGWKKLKKFEKTNGGLGWWSGVGADETRGWQPPLQGLVTMMCKPTAPKVTVKFGEQDLQEFFTVMRLESLAISRIDAKFPRFKNVEELCLVGNEIHTVENLPLNLRQLELATNRIGQLGALGPVSARLRRLGLAYNQLYDGETNLDQPFDSLVSLDLSNNRFADLPNTLTKLQRLPQLKQLYLDGNPFCLRPQYRAIVLAALPSLSMLDGQEVATAQLEAAQAFSAPVTEGAVRTVPELVGTASDACKLSVSLGNLDLVVSPSWPLLAEPEPVEEGEEPAVVEPPVLDLELYRYEVRYTLVGDVDVSAASTPLTLEPQEGFEWTGVPSSTSDAVAGSVNIGLAQVHSLDATEALRDALVRGHLCFELWETAASPVNPDEEVVAPEPEEGATADIAKVAPEPVLIGVGVAAADPVDSLVVGDGVRVEQLLTDSVARIYPLGESQASLVMAVRFVTPPRAGAVVDRTGTTVGTIAATITLNEEAPPPPEPESEEGRSESPTKGKGGKKKK